MAGGGLRRLRLATERRLNGGPRVVASAGWRFPIYSHTFVYQELAQLAGAGFNVRLIYGARDRHAYLSSQYRPVERSVRRFSIDPMVCRHALAHFERRVPERVTRLLGDLSTASGLPVDVLLAHAHVQQGFAYAWAISTFRPDYLHSYFFYQDTLYSLMASMLLGVPRGVTCYADHMLDDYDLKLVGLHLGQCHVVVATSERVRRELLGIAPNLPPHRIIVKPNGINPQRFPFVDRADPDPPQPWRLASVCRIDPKKGLVGMLEAVALLTRQGRRIEWSIAGGVDDNDTSRRYYQQLMDRRSALGLTDAVHVLGKLNEAELNALLAQAHLFVAPFVETPAGDKDGIPTALLEAMATGAPVVATDSGSITEVVDGDNGVIVPQASPGALAAAIAELLGDRGRRARIGRAGADTVRRRFDARVTEQPFHDCVRALAAQVPLTAPVAR